MKKLEQVVQRIQNLPQLLQNTSPLTISETSISVYSGTLTTQAVIEGVKKIKLAFPNMPPGFYEILSDRIKENSFTDERFLDAVDYVIDNCIYPNPTIAQFVGFDKRIKTFTYNQICQMVEDGDTKAFEHYQRVVLKDRPVPIWIHVNDIALYKLVSEEVTASNNIHYKT